MAKTAKKKRRGGTALVLALLLLFGAVRAAAAPAELETALNNTAKYVYQTVNAPQVGSVGGEWAVMGLARSGYPVPESYYQKYYTTVENHVKARGGVLDQRKYTEYSRVIVALSAIGKDARKVAGYDLTRPLGDYDKTVWQGLNGPVWALIALDSAGYPMPENPEAATQATRQMYVDRILNCQLPDGGWSLTATSETSDPDVTGMALQALAKYQDQPAVARAVQRALACMSARQSGDGGFSSWDTPNSESAVQMLVALCELGIAWNDARFVKDGVSLLDNLLSFSVPGAGFAHTKDGSGTNLMATEQALYALAAVQRAAQGKNSLYRMSDALTVSDAAGAAPAKGLAGKNPAVQAVPVAQAGKTFPDISASREAAAITALAARGIITGKPDGTFDPAGNMSRSEFAAIVVRALGLTPKANQAFSDVASNAWYASYVGTASDFGMINGVGNGQFLPLGTITRQEAAVMAARAAKLCGLETELDAATARNVLAQFPDYTSAGEWARPSLAFCYQSGILSQDDLEIRPLENATRAEISQMLYNMLNRANLL